MKKSLIKRFSIVTMSSLLLLGCTNSDNEVKGVSVSNESKSSDGTVQVARTKVSQFANTLDLSANPTEEVNGEYSTNKFNHFSDLGAWHGYYLPAKNNKELLGGFAGPLIIAEEYPVNLSNSINRIQITNKNTKEKYDLSRSSYSDLSYYPGKLVQIYDLNDIKLTLQLIFVSDRSALVETTIENTGDESIELDVSWEGSVFDKVISGDSSIDMGTSLESDGNAIQVNFSEVREQWDYFATDEVKYYLYRDEEIDTKIDGLNYKSELVNAVTLEPEESFETYATETYTFTDKEFSQEQDNLSDFIKNNKEYFKDNENRWQEYLDNTFDKETIEEYPEYQNAAVKAVQTLMTNWRSPAGAINYDGIIPSMSYKWFVGMWAWDSWKADVALAEFNPELAKNNMRALFDYQIDENDDVRPQDAGTIIDVIFYNQDAARGGEGGNWNERNSKPPLAAWAAWHIYQKTDDTAFLEEMYPKLMDYHNWWYTNRDHQQNGIAEYGAMVSDMHWKTTEDGEIITDSEGNPEFDEDAIIEAAAWESGMDDATRFDKEGQGEDDSGVKVFENKMNNDVLGYSLNQESVDLNAYLYAEKGFLYLMANELGKEDDTQILKEDAEYVKNYVQENMFDEETGTFYDLQINEDGSETKKLVNRGKGTEGWLPLWANLATEEQAEAVKNNIMDSEKFNTYVPFPTASKDNPKFEEDQYWRGPVWLDQAIFGVEALQNYNFDQEAIVMTKKLFNNAEGLMGNGPIHENYNPLNGKGISTKNFTWSSGAYYSMYKNVLLSDSPTTQDAFK